MRCALVVLTCLSFGLFEGCAMQRSMTRSLAEKRVREKEARTAAEEWLAGYAARRSMEWVDSWLDRRRDDPPEWQGVSGTSDYLLDVTPGELDELLEAITALLTPHLRRVEGRADGAEGSADVRLLLQTFLRGDDE